MPTHSFLGGGHCNTISGRCSTILGGCGNSDAGCSYAGIYGQGITAQANGHMHINNLWIAPTTYNTYNGIAPTGTFPNGTVYIDVSLGSGKPLRMQ